MTVTMFTYMVKLNMHQAKTHLSEHVAGLKPGDEILLCRRNIPVARIIPITSPPGLKPRPLGLAKGQVVMPADFNEPLPNDLLDAFTGR